MTEEPITWARIKAAALDGGHPLVNETEHKIMMMCPNCKTWQPEEEYYRYRLPFMPEYHSYLATVRRCSRCQFVFAVVA